MVTRTPGSGTKYDTKVRSGSNTSSSRSKPTATRSRSGSEKLADFRERAEARASPGQTPEQYRRSVSRSPSGIGSDVSPMARGAPQPQQPTTRPVTQAEIEAARRNLPGIGISPLMQRVQPLGFNVPQPEPRSSAEISSEIVRSQTQQTASYVPFMKSQEQQLREAEQREQKAAMDLGRFESRAAGYEQYVGEKLEPVVTSSSPAVRFVGGAAEAVAYTPVAVPRMIAGLSRDPAGTVKGTVQGTAEQVISDPARGAGQIAGMVVTGKAAGKAGGIIKEKTPIIRTTAADQGVLVKIKVPEAQKATTPKPEMFDQAEFRASAFGYDWFDMTKTSGPKGAKPTGRAASAEFRNIFEQDVNAAYGGVGAESSLIIKDNIFYKKGGTNKNLIDTGEPKLLSEKPTLDSIQEIYNRQQDPARFPLPKQDINKNTFGKGGTSAERLQLPEGMGPFEGFTKGSKAKGVPDKPRTFVGETKDGLTDVYFEVTKKQAGQLSRQFEGDVRNIRTQEGSFLEFEPTRKIEPKTSTKDPNVPEPEIPRSSKLIGEFPEKQVRPFGAEPSGQLFRIEKRVKLQEADIDFVESNRLQIPEFTKTVDAKGRVVNDFNIYDYYKTPDVAEPLALQSGTTTIKVPIEQTPRTLASDTRGQLFPKRFETKQVKSETFLGEMPEMQTRYVRFAEPAKALMSNPFKSDLETILKRTGPESKNPFAQAKPKQKTNIAANIKRAPKPKGSTIPLVVSIPKNAVMGKTKPEPISTPSTQPITKTSTETKTDTIVDAIRGTDTSADTDTVTATEFRSGVSPAPTENPFAPSASGIVTPPPKIPPLKFGKQKGKSRDTGDLFGSKRKVTTNPFKELTK